MVTIGHHRKLLDAGDLQAGQGLTVTHALAVTGLVLVLHDADLRALLIPNDLGGHSHLGKSRSVCCHLLTVHQEECGQFNGLTGVAGKTVDDDDVTNGNLLLAATSLDDRVHHVAAHLS